MYASHVQKWNNWANFNFPSTSQYIEVDKALESVASTYLTLNKDFQLICRLSNLTKSFLNPISDGPALGCKLTL